MSSSRSAGSTCSVSSRNTPADGGCPAMSGGVDRNSAPGTHRRTLEVLDPVSRRLQRGPVTRPVTEAKAQEAPATEELSPSHAVALDAFARHLRSERGLSPHTVRAYVGDITTLLDHATRLGITDPHGLDLATL